MLGACGQLRCMLQSQGWTRERVLHDTGSQGRLLMVVASDGPAQIRRVSEICTQLEQSLGFSPGWSLPRSFTDRGSSTELMATASSDLTDRTAGDVRVFLRISPSKAVIGVLVLERLGTVNNAAVASTSKCQGQAADGQAKCLDKLYSQGMRPLNHEATASSREVHHGVSEHERASFSGMELASEKQPAVVCGVRLMWVSQGHRRQGITTAMLDVARCAYNTASFTA